MIVTAVVAESSAVVVVVAVVAVTMIVVAVTVAVTATILVIRIAAVLVTRTVTLIVVASVRVLGKKVETVGKEILQARIGTGIKTEGGIRRRSPRTILKTKTTRSQEGRGRRTRRKRTFQ